MKLIMGGHFLQSETTGKAGVKRFEGIGYIGYDNLQEGYDVIWIDNMSTGILRATASYDEDTKVLTEVGQFSDPTDPDKNQKYKAEWKFIDKNNMTYTTFIEQDGLPMKQMEIVYKRKK